MKLKIGLKKLPQKLIALIFVLLMFVSSMAFAVINSLTNKEETINMPNQNIINFELNEQQRTQLLQNYYTLIEYRYFTGCIDCITMKNELERITQTSEGQIYLQELVSSQNTTSSITITSLKGQKSFENPDIEQTQENICKLLIRQPLWCVSSKI